MIRYVEIITDMAEETGWDSIEIIADLFEMHKYIVECLQQIMDYIEMRKMFRTVLQNNLEIYVENGGSMNELYEIIMDII